MTSALMALAGQKVSETRRECTKSGATLVYCMAEKVGDKNLVVLRGPTQTTATWRRLGSWSSRISEWSFDAVELARVGLT